MYFHKKIPLSLLVIVLTLATIFHHSIAQNSNQNFLDTHNSARASVSVGAMTWNTTLANYATNYANSRKVDCNTLPSGGPYGENIGKGAGATFTAIVAVNSWVAQNYNYVYSTNTCSPGQICSSYTQVVWANSGQLGCARVLCNNLVYYIAVCSYSPKGNVVGEWPY